MAKHREYYIDNIRILLTCLVVLLHLAVTYGAAGTWYYTETNASPLACFVLTLFTATNQAFFMGMFFMISAYFLDKSLQRKSQKNILRDKFKRLGIPYVFYVLLISPLIIYLSIVLGEGKELSLMDFLSSENWTRPGPVWFNSALLIFTIVALILKGKHSIPLHMSLPKDKILILISVVLGIVSFMIRILFPVNWKLPILNFQLAHFAQYTLLFYAGLLSSRNNWFSQLSYKRGISYLRLVLLLVFVAFPLGFYLGGALENGTDSFLGGFTWQSLFFSVWEQVTGFSIILGLLAVFKTKFNKQGKSLQKASASAYTVFIIHALILVLFSLLIKDLDISGVLKFVVLAPVVLFTCFALANKLRKFRYLRQIL